MKILSGVIVIVVIIFFISLVASTNNIEPAQQQIHVPEKPKRIGILKHDADSLAGATSRVLCHGALPPSAGTRYAIQRGAKIEILEDKNPEYSDAIRIRIIEGVGVSLPRGVTRINTNKNDILCWTTTGVILESDDPTVQRTDIERYDF